jgi:uncharacterized protein (DUF1697 family)
MTRYVAFLRAVNVGGHAVIKMEDIVLSLEKAGLGNVSSYRQSGNVIFSSTITDMEAIGRMIRDPLERLTGSKIDIFTFTIERLGSLVGSDPFEGQLTEGDRTFATFMSEKPSNIPSMPVLFQNGIGMIGLTENIAFSVVSKDAGSGPVNDLVERRFKVRATTRNWSTVKGIVAKAFPEQKAPE